MTSIQAIMAYSQPSALPKWLHYSQYLPLSTGTDDDLAGLFTLQLKPSYGLISRSKRVRIVAAAVFIVTSSIYAFYGLRMDFRFDYSPNPAHSKPSLESLAQYSRTEIDWSRFAYTQYVTNIEYLCNPVMLFEVLHRLGSKADRLMMYPVHMEPDPTSSKIESKLLLKAREDYDVNLVPIEVQHRSIGDRKSSQPEIPVPILMN